MKYSDQCALSENRRSSFKTIKCFVFVSRFSLLSLLTPPLVSCFKWYLWFYCFFVPSRKDHYLFRETTVLFWQSSLPNFMSSKVSTLWLFDYEGLTMEWNNSWKRIQMHFHRMFFIFLKQQARFSASKCDVRNWIFLKS